MKKTCTDFQFLSHNVKKTILRNHQVSIYFTVVYSLVLDRCTGVCVRVCVFIYTVPAWALMAAVAADVVRIIGDDTSCV